MTDNLPTIWERAAHTRAKHQILQAYLNAWIPIMSQQSRRIGPKEAQLLFVDGFAGPGCYAGGEDGSPVLAIKSVLAHSQDLPVPISFLFIEEDADRRATLEAKLQEYRQGIPSPRIKAVNVKEGDCETVINELLDESDSENRQLGPALFFFDQFGFADVSMVLVRRIMSKPLCEVFSYLNWDHMYRFLSDQNKWASISRAYGGDEWKPVSRLELNHRAAFMLQAYKEALKTKAGSKYVWSFTMSDEADNVLYWLFFCTNNLRGLEEMKKAMWSVDPSGGFRFSDKDDPSQLHLFRDYTEVALANELASRLADKTVEVSQVREFVLAETPAYRFKNSLKAMEDDGRLEPVDPPASRRKGTFADEHMRVHFVSRR